MVLLLCRDIYCVCSLLICQSIGVQALASGRGQQQAAAVQGLLQHAEAVRAKKAEEAAAQAAAAQAALHAA